MLYFCAVWNRTLHGSGIHSCEFGPAHIHICGSRIHAGSNSTQYRSFFTFCWVAKLCVWQSWRCASFSLGHKYILTVKLQSSSLYGSTYVDLEFQIHSVDPGFTYVDHGSHAWIPDIYYDKCVDLKFGLCGSGTAWIWDHSNISFQHLTVSNLQSTCVELGLCGSRIHSVDL